MAEYYYFAATLPMLSMDREAPITYSAFMEQAKAHLTRRDYSDLEKAVMAAADGDAKLPLVRAWQAYAGRIRRLMNSYRAARLGFPGYEAREGGDRMLEVALLFEGADDLCAQAAADRAGVIVQPGKGIRGVRQAL